MVKKRAKSNIIIIVITILLVISILMIRFEKNPFSFFIETIEEQIEEQKEKVINYNGVYLYKEHTNSSTNLYSGCTINYFDNYIVVINEKYHVFRSSCVGTFYLTNGQTADLKFEESGEQNLYIDLEEQKYYKTDSINNIQLINNEKEFQRVTPDHYKMLLEESSIDNHKLSLDNISFKISLSKVSFSFKDQENKHLFTISNEEGAVYSKVVDQIDELPNLKSFGEYIIVLDEIEDSVRYNYDFKAISDEGITYDMKDKFPIKVNGVELTNADNRIIKYDEKDNKYTMLVSKNKQMCLEDVDSNEIAYYVFDINYNYLNKAFDKPEFNRIVYKREGCTHFDDLMGR